jgi:hypothetical protein
MTRHLIRFLALSALTAGLYLTAAGEAQAQTTKSCPDIFKDKHKALECIEGVFSETPLHLSFSSIPPGNGFPLGIVYENPTHNVEKYKSLTDPKLAFVGSTNGSWYATGALTWLPPLPYTNQQNDAGACHKWGILCTEEVFGLTVYASHRSLNSLSFYGLGSSTPGTQYIFKQRDTYGGLIVRLPLTDWLRIDGQIEDRAPEILSNGTPSSVTANFTDSTAPGLSAQPNFLHPAVTIRTTARHIAERATDPLGAPAGANTPLMKARTALRFQNNASYHWYSDRDTGQYSFQQFVFDGDESIQFGSVLQQFVTPGSSWMVDHLCGGNKATDTCDFGTLDIKSYVSVANVGSSKSMPFYLMPTIGGSDIDSQVSLRAFDNYRFRDRDAAVVQVEFGRTIKDPLGAFIFYDGGLVGNSVSDLKSSTFRQDGGAGVSLRLAGRVVAQGFVAAGAGNGTKIGYQFVKFF